MTKRAIMQSCQGLWRNAKYTQFPGELKGLCIAQVGPEGAATQDSWRSMDGVSVFLSCKLLGPEAFRYIPIHN